MTRTMESGRAILIREQGREVCFVIEEDGGKSRHRRLTKDNDGEYEIDGRTWRAEPSWIRDMGTFHETVDAFLKEEPWPKESGGPIRDISDEPNNLPSPWEDDIKA